MQNMARAEHTDQEAVKSPKNDSGYISKMPMMKITTLPQRGSLDYSPRGAVQSTVPHSVEHRGVVQTTVPQKGRAQCTRRVEQNSVPLKGQCRAHYSTGAMHIIAQEGNAEHSAPEGQCTSIQEGKCRTECPKKGQCSRTKEGQCRTECPRGAVPQKWQYRAHCPRRAVPQMGSTEHSAQVASAQCPRRAKRSTATEGQSEHSPGGAVRTQPRRGSQNTAPRAVQGKERKRTAVVSSSA